MTDRIKGFIVTLDKDIRSDDVEPILNAIRCIVHVQSVDPLVADINDFLARQRVRHELGQQLWEVLYPKKKADE